MDILTQMMASKKPIEGGGINTIYIDPTYGSNGVGTIVDPKNTFVGLTITNNYTYRVKCGTTYSFSSEISLGSRTGVIITSYGSGAKPIMSFTGAGTCAIRFAGSTNCFVVNLDITSDILQSVLALIQMGTGSSNDGGTGLTVSACKLHNVKQGVSAGGIGIRGGGTNILIRDCEIYDTGDDGLYFANTTNLEIGYCNIHHVNQNYAGTAKGFLAIGNSALGDGIQIDGYWNNLYIHNTTIDRTDIYTGNKFALILGGVVGPAIFNTGLVEHCSFKVRTGFNITYCVYIGQGDGVIFRYNRVQGATGGVRVIGQYCLNTLIHSNIFTDCTGSVAIVYDPINLGYPIDTIIHNNVFVRGSTYAQVTIAGNACELRNNIFDGSMTAFTASGSATYTKQNNCYQDPAKIGSGGLEAGGITGDPLFVDAVNNDFHLQITSACLDAGIDVGITEDFEGNTNANLNMGVYF
jgi:hypothetical protein